jgi:dTDP-4-amino-4,6-dideoxygalactose transaminase
VAQRYTNALSNRFQTPYVPDGLTSIWAQYTIKCASAGERDALQERAKAAGVPTVIYYPIPLHRQNAYSEFPRDPAGLEVSDDLSERVISLPMHAYLKPEVQDRIIEAAIG